MAAATLVHLVHRSGRIGSYPGRKRTHHPAHRGASSQARGFTARPLGTLVHASRRRPFSPVCARLRPLSSVAGRFTTSCPLQRRPTLGSYPRLTPRLRRTCIPGVVASFTMRSDTLFTDTSCPLNGLPICVIWYATSSSWVNQPGRRKGVIEVGDLDDGHRVAVQVEHAAVPLARHLAVDPHRADEDEGA